MVSSGILMAPRWQVYIPENNIQLNEMISCNREHEVNVIE